MKTIKFTFAIAIIALTIPACNLDTGGGLLKPKDIEPIILLNRYDEDIVLADHNEDGVDYIATGEVKIYNGDMTIEPGVTIQFEDGASFLVGLEGKLEAVGTSGQPIRMIAEDNSPSWAGIYINTFKSNKIHHVQIENAGSGEKYGIYNNNAAAITIDGKVSIENTIISKSGGVGVQVNGVLSLYESDIVSFSGNTIRECVSFPIFTHINYAEDLDLTSNIFSDNGMNMIGMDGDRLTENSELDAAGIPYFLSEEVELYANLTLNRGVEIVMADNTAIEHEAGDDYRFQIKGTENDHVVIRGAESANGFWKGISIESENSGNVFDFLDISDGGGSELTSADAKANISLEWEGKLEMNNCTSARSGECEVLLSNFGGKKYEFVNNSPAITKICEE